MVRNFQQAWDAPLHSTLFINMNREKEEMLALCNEWAKRKHIGFCEAQNSQEEESQYV